MSTIKELADEVSKLFGKITRDADKKEIWVIKDHKNEPEWVLDFIREAHGNMFPDDFVYEFVVEALDAISDADDPEDVTLEADVYYSELLAWFHSNPERPGMVDEIIQEIGYDKDSGIFGSIGYAELREKEQVYAVVLQALKDKQEELVNYPGLKTGACEMANATKELD